MWTLFVIMHPKFQGARYRLFRALMFVATGLSGVAPLVHGLKIFRVSQMMRKAFLYTMVKAGCLLSGTAFYAVSFQVLHPRERLKLTQLILKDQVSRKSISWQIRPTGVSYDLPYPGGMRRCGAADRVSGYFRLCSSKLCLLVTLRCIQKPCR